MISLFSGTPGSYKSYHAVKEALTALKRGKNLITNFPLNFKNVIKRPIRGCYECVSNNELTVDYLISFACDHHKKGLNSQTLVIIDEASIKFNSRDFNNHDRMQWINFFANHRHFNFDFILITQDHKMLDRQIRSLLEVEVKHRSLKQYMLLGLILGSSGFFQTVEYWYPCKFKTQSLMNKFDKRIASCYDTMGLFVDSQNKMSLARQELNTKEVISIAKVNDSDSKKQISENLSMFCSVLRRYTYYNS